MDNLARLLKESWTLVEDDRARLGGHFYARLFLLDPALRQLFPVQMTGQGDRLLEAIITAIHTVDDPESFDEFLRALGRDHRKYHVADQHYATVGVALLDALRSTAGDGWNLEYDQAWREAYAAIAALMIAGAADDEDPPFWHAEVLTHQRYGPDTAVLTCRALQHPLRWRAGQYVSLEVPRHHPRVWRNYSVANAPKGDNVLEFHVRSPGAGWVSGALVRRVRPGELLRLAAPMGSMTLDRASDRDILCVAGGVGLAPIKALVEELATYNRTGGCTSSTVPAIRRTCTAWPGCRSWSPYTRGCRSPRPAVTTRTSTVSWATSGRGGPVRPVDHARLLRLRLGPDGPVHAAGARRGRGAAAAHPLRHLR